MQDIAFEKTTNEGNLLPGIDPGFLVFPSQNSNV
jgi:hypothetical protein